MFIARRGKEIMTQLARQNETGSLIHYERTVYYGRIILFGKDVTETYCRV